MPTQIKSEIKQILTFNCVELHKAEDKRIEQMNLF